MAMIKPFPFKVDRSCANSFRDQIVDGLRSAIDTGYYRPGDLLPPLRIAASACGASEIVVRAAYRFLASDGLVVARPRVGSVVLPRKAASWKGHVLCVMGDYDFNLAQCGIVGSLRTRLMANGFLFTQVMALSDSLVRLDLSQLRNALKRKVDFAIQIFSRKEISDTLSKAGIPFVVYGKCETAPDGCVGIFRYSPDRAMRSFVVDCRKRGIGSVEVVCCDRIRPCASQMLSLLEGAGIRVSVRWLKAKTHIGRTHSAEQIGYDFICHNVNRSSSRLPDAYLVHDDYLARGMLTALNVKGFHVPEDVGFVCVTQKGFAPVFAKALTRIEMDSYAAGEKIAKRVLAWLTRKAPIGDDPLEAVYVNGSTLA